MVKGGEKA